MSSTEYNFEKLCRYIDDNFCKVSFSTLTTMSQLSDLVYRMSLRHYRTILKDMMDDNVDDKEIKEKTFLTLVCMRYLQDQDKSNIHIALNPLKEDKKIFEEYTNKVLIDLEQK